LELDGLCFKVWDSFSELLLTIHSNQTYYLVIIFSYYVDVFKYDEPKQ